MSHVRKQIRDAVATRVTGLTTTGTNVFQSRTYSLSNDKLPALTIYTKEESSDIVNMSRDLRRTLSIVIEGYAKASSSLDDTLDTIAAEVEAAMGSDRDLNGVGKIISVSGTEIDFASGDSEKPVGVVRLGYDIIYVTSGSDPETAL
ncbi:hypothetical protein HN588_09145 [Candidatus Bathyarchaeota archaeon]|jgi:hypothetical protein|nr:hypothetical protein [Candidatus Bathyarchaeota archaeon]